MAHSYYSPRRARRHSISDIHDRNSTVEELAGDLEQSIFIFPSPTTRTGSSTDVDVAPPSPLSIPTDASFPTSSPSTTNTEDVSRGRRISNASGFSQWTFSGSGRSVSVDTSLRSPLVEVWEMSDDASENEDVNGQTPLPSSPQMQHFQQRIPLGRRPFPSHFVFSGGRLQLRARKESFISSADSANEAVLSSNPDSAAGAKHADASHLPLLAFFSSLLSVEDTTTHLLTRPSPPYTSPLFPGCALQSQSQSTTTPDTIFDEKRAFFASSPTASLKSGMEVASDRDPSVTSKSVFSLPKPLPVPCLPFTYFMDLVKELCTATVPMKMRLVARPA